MCCHSSFMDKWAHIGVIQQMFFESINESSDIPFILNVLCECMFRNSDTEIYDSKKCLSFFLFIWWGIVLTPTVCGIQKIAHFQT